MPPRLPIRVNALKKILPRSSASFEASSVLRSTTTSPQFLISPGTIRSFSHSPVVLKKGGKSKAERKAELEVQDEDGTESKKLVEDPYDFSELESGIEKALEKLKNDLSKLRTGGRFNPEVIENLRVKLSKEGKKTERLGDLAQVLPKGGRMLMILVGDKDHLHAVMSAIQGAKDINLQPQPDAQNSHTQLNVPIPPPTKESRDQALAAASKTGDIAKTAVQSARSVQQKRLRAIELKRAARPDDVKKAQKEMEKIVERANGEVKKTVEAARKNMEQS